VVPVAVSVPVVASPVPVEDAVVMSRGACGGERAGGGLSCASWALHRYRRSLSDTKDARALHLQAKIFVEHLSHEVQAFVGNNEVVRGVPSKVTRNRAKWHYDPADAYVGPVAR
jgi:hypothetical protein